MKGLLIKDFCLLKQRKMTLVIFAILAIFLSAYQDPVFAVSYLPICALIILVGTMSYDEMDNGYTFLMTMPITPKLYVFEKYVFCIGGTVISWVLGVLFYFALEVNSGLRTDGKIDWVAYFTMKDFVQRLPDAQDIPMVFLLLFLILFVLSVMLPIQLKFGLEKGRIALLLVYGVIILGVLAIGNFIGQEQIEAVVTSLGNLNLWLILLGVSVIPLAVLFVSFLISVKIMEKKQY